MLNARCACCMHPFFSAAQSTCSAPPLLCLSEPCPQLIEMVPHWLLCRPGAIQV